MPAHSVKVKLEAVARRPDLANRVQKGRSTLYNGGREERNEFMRDDARMKRVGADGSVEPGEHRGAASSQPRVEKVLRLFRQMGELEAKIDFEPSFKAVRGRLFGDRLLLGLDRRETGGSRDERIVAVCANIGMPHDLLSSFRQGLPDANHVYFGVEGKDGTLLFKAYLEFRDRIEKEIGDAPAAGRSFPLFTGFKWDSFTPGRQAVSRYIWYPSLPVAEMLERLQRNLDAGRHGGLLELVQGIARRAEERISPADIQYLEVVEEGNPRSSFDLNIYKSGLRLEDLCPDLLRALRHYAIPFNRFELLYQRIKSERFGHLAGGVDRENEDFMTVYYGVKDIHSSQLGSARMVPEDRPPQPRW
jgi:hypothetical protein